MRQVGHLDPAFLELMNEVQQLLRYAWQTDNGLTIPVSGTGSAAMEAAIANVVEPGDVVLVANNGYFGNRLSDVAYSGAQKCLSCPPGVSPLSLGERATAKLRSRKTKVRSWYLDVSLLEKYWGEDRTYHHTAPINMNYALREALRLVAEEGLENRWARHRENAEYLWSGLAELGIGCQVAEPHRVPSLTTAKVPEGVDAKTVCQRLLAEYNIEIAGGLGELAGRVWRIGLMGFNSRRENVDLLLSALRHVLVAR